MSNTINIEIDETLIKKLIHQHVSSILGEIELNENDVQILIKSKQNYRAEWETAAFRATVRKLI